MKYIILIMGLLSGVAHANTFKDELLKLNDYQLSVVDEARQKAFAELSRERASREKFWNKINYTCDNNEKLHLNLRTRELKYKKYHGEISKGDWQDAYKFKDMSILVMSNEIQLITDDTVICK